MTIYIHSFLVIIIIRRNIEGFVIHPDLTGILRQLIINIADLRCRGVIYVALILLGRRIIIGAAIIIGRRALLLTVLVAVIVSVQLTILTGNYVSSCAVVFGHRLIV